MKVHELAKKLNLKAVDLLKQLKDNGEDVNSINSTLSEEQQKSITEILTGSSDEFSAGPSGNYISQIAFVREIGDEKYQLVKATVDENNNLKVQSVKEYASRVRAFHDLGYENGLIEMVRAVRV